MECPPLQRVKQEDQDQARSNIAPYAIRTPLVELKYRRLDHPQLRIYLKLETLQPVGSFKIRSAVNAIASRTSQLESMTGEKLVVTASAGNMGQGIAYACRDMNCSCIVIVPDFTPQTKVDAMEKNYGARVIKVAYNVWWSVIITRDCSKLPEIGDTPHVFIHPVCDDAVVAGNATCGAEILEEIPDANAILVPYAGGGFTCGIGSAVLNHYDAQPDDGDAKKCSVVSCEPETAAPMALSKIYNTMTSFQDYFQPSFCDGCGGKAILPAMWPLADKVVDASVAVPIEAIKAAVWTLHEQNKVVAEGAGAITVAAAMFAPLELLGVDAQSWDKVVCVISGAGIDRAKLCDVLQKFDSLQSVRDLGPSLDWTVRGSPEYKAQAEKQEENVASTLPHHQPQLTILHQDEIRNRLPMHRCIQAAREALTALSNKTGRMPLRQYTTFPQDEIGKVGVLASMPSYLDGYAACKLLTVYPQNATCNSGYSSHQGLVALFNAKNHGEMILLADAHAITSWRTAAASAVASQVLARSDSKVLSLLGTGELARTHFIAILEAGFPIECVKLWGRSMAKMEQLKAELAKLLETYRWTEWPLREYDPSSPSLKFECCSSVQECVKHADIVCTLTASHDPILKGAWVAPGLHINAVGACFPHTRELDGDCLAKAVVYCDSMEGCLAEAGDVVLAVKDGVIGMEHVQGEIGALLLDDSSLSGRKCEKDVTVFESLGIALEDLTAVRALYETK